MKEKTEDRRVQFTKMFLKNALISLMQEKPVSKITPTELCRVANINRNTFYAHYRSTFDVLKEIEEELYNEILNTMEFTEGTVLNLRALCKAIKDQKDTCAVILSENGDKSFLLKVIASAKDITLENWQRISPFIGEKESAICFDYCANGSVSLIYNWVHEGMEMPYQEVARILESLNNAVLNSFLKNKNT